MSNHRDHRDHRAVRSISLIEDPAARMAAARARWPQLAGTTRRAVERGTALTRVPARDLPAALLCVTVEQARDLVARDRRVGARTALEVIEGEGTETTVQLPLAAHPVPVVIDGRISMQAFREVRPRPDAGETFTVLAAAFRLMDRANAPEVDDDVVALADDYFAGRLGLVRDTQVHLLDTMAATTSDAVVDFAARLAPLNGHGALLASNWMGATARQREITAALRLDDGFRRDLMSALASGQLAPWSGRQLSTPWLHVLDIHAGAAAAGPLAARFREPLGVRVDSGVDTVRQLTCPELRSVVLEALLEGTLGYVTSPEDADWLVEQGASRPAVSAVLEGTALVEWICDADAELLVAMVGQRGIVRRSSYLPLPIDARDALYAAMVDHTPGLLSELVGAHGLRDELVAAVMDRLAAELGEDENRWSQLWGMAPDFPGTVPTAVAVTVAAVG